MDIVLSLDEEICDFGERNAGQTFILTLIRNTKLVQFSIAYSRFDSEDRRLIRDQMSARWGDESKAKTEIAYRHNMCHAFKLVRQSILALTAAP